MSETVSALGEFGVIALLRSVFEAGASDGARPEVGNGDDAAVIAVPEGESVVWTTDTLVEGRHYLPDHVPARSVGRRAMAASLSDVGAMGGTPRWALVSLGLHGDVPVRWVADLAAGLREEADAAGTAVCGGNVTSVEGAPFVEVSVLGGVPRGAAVLRSGGRPGDAVWVTGAPGESGAGLRLLLAGAAGDGLESLTDRYRSPGNRAGTGRALARTGLVHAMLDVSDGLGGDLEKLARASGVRVDLDRDAIPVGAVLSEAARRLDLDPIELVLGPSDDYELLVVAEPESGPLLVDALPAGVLVHRIGLLAPGPQAAGPDGAPPVVFLRDDEGAVPWTDSGWDHLLAGRG